jgi:hypothetical protein
VTKNNHSLAMTPVPGTPVERQGELTLVSASVPLAHDEVRRQIQVGTEFAGIGARLFFRSMEENLRAIGDTMEAGFRMEALRRQEGLLMEIENEVLALAARLAASQSVTQRFVIEQSIEMCRQRLVEVYRQVAPDMTGEETIVAVRRMLDAILGRKQAELSEQQEAAMLLELYRAGKLYVRGENGQRGFTRLVLDQ